VWSSYWRLSVLDLRKRGLYRLYTLVALCIETRIYNGFCISELLAATL
jgi:hypothetical protein